MLSLHLMSPIKKLSLLTLAFLLLTTCSLFSPKAPSYPSGVFFPVTIDGEIVYQGKSMDLIQREGDKLYLSTQNGVVYCFDSVNRKILWERKISDDLVSSPFLGAENIYVYDRKGVLYCLDKKGGLSWTIDVEENITSGILEFKANVCFGTKDGNLYAFDTTSGKEIWRFRAEGAIQSTPVFTNNTVIFGCDDHKLYILSEGGDLVGNIEVEGKIQGTPHVENNSVYFGSDDHHFYCFGLKSRKKKWKVKTGGKLFTPPEVAGKRILFLCWNNVLYCLNKKRGHIIWWQMIPSRSYYRLEISGDRVVVSSLSSVLLSFDLETGESTGEFNAEQELASNPMWFDPYLLISLYDPLKDTGKILFLKKIVRVVLKPSKESPRKVGEEVRFTVSVRGFFMPQYEFYLKEGEEEIIVQEISERNSWTWFPEKTGDYLVGVRVFDGKENASAEISFSVQENQELK